MPAAPRDGNALATGNTPAVTATRQAIRPLAVALAVLAALAGLPAGVIAGIVAGHLAWAAFAAEAGVAEGASFDLGLVLITVPVTLLLANLIAAWPGRQAARLCPAAALRTG